MKKKVKEERHHHPTQAQNQKRSSASSVFLSADPPLPSPPSRQGPAPRHHRERPITLGAPRLTTVLAASHLLRPLGSLSMGFFPVAPHQAASSASPRAVSSVTVTIWNPRARGKWHLLLTVGGEDLLTIYIFNSR